jgi:hypothetical protein
VLDRLRVAATPLLGSRSMTLSESLATARATWHRRAVGYGIRLFRDAKVSYDLTA